MKILQVIPRFNPNLGGGVHVVYNLSKQMTKRGHEVTIITTDYGYDEEYAKTIRKEGVEVIPFEHIVNVCLFIPSPKMKSWLSKNIQNYDLIHLNGARAYQNNIVHKYAKKYGIPYILQAHGSMLRIVERQKLKQLYDIVWGYNVFRDASKVLALSHSEGDAYKIMGVNEDKIKIVPNGIDLLEFDDLPKKGEFMKRYSIQADTKLILYLGRLHESKGIGLLLQSFAELLIKLNGVKLVLVGPDERFESKLKQCVETLGIEKHIIFTGLVPNSEKLMAFVDADIFVTPKFYGFPITFAESCVCGLPIITTNEGDKLDWIHNKAGYISDYNKHDLMDAMLILLTDDTLRARLSDGCKNLARDEFNWSLIAEKVEEIYLNV